MAGFSVRVSLAKVKTTMDVTVIGYGSLMSGWGLSASGPFHVKQAFIVALAGCRRGFAKLSRYGDHFAMDLELRKLPLHGHVPATAPNGEVEALALTLPLEEACRLARREGYEPAAMQQLARMAQARGLTIANFLWELSAEAGYEVVRYRRQLFALTGFTSAHYIPHPVRLGDAEDALIFLAPGFEGTGADGVVSVRQQTGIQTIMRTGETWRRKPTADQLTYFIVCLLGGVHGICIRDLLPPADEEPQLCAELGVRITGALAQEVEHFLAATGFSPARYRQAFGEPEEALVRSGLWEFLQKQSGNDES
jgi:hypothetical protein